MTYNWFYIILCGIVPVAVVIGMATVMTVTYVKERVEKKRRDRRCHQPISEWWELRVTK